MLVEAFCSCPQSLEALAKVMSPLGRDRFHPNPSN